MDRVCAGCGEPLTWPGRSNRRHHDARCRKAAYTRRQRERQAPGLAERNPSEVDLVEYVARGGQTNWRAAAWLLERRYPERWGPGAEPEPAIPDEPDRFAEIDELAVRRRRSPTASPVLPRPRPPDEW